MIARLEGDVQRRAGHGIAAARGVVDRLDFGMRLAAQVVETLAERLRAARNDGPDARVGRRISATAGSELARPPQIDAIEAGNGRDYAVTSTPFQKATESLICFAASFGAG